MARVMAAVRPECRSLLGRIFETHEIIFVETMSNAEEVLLAESLGMVICSLLFDDSRMFELLRLCKESDSLKHLPFVCFKASAAELSPFPVVLEGVTIAANVLGASAFLDLDEQTVEDAREVIEQLLTVKEK